MRRRISTSSATRDFVGALMCVSITLWASRVNDSVIYVPVSRCWLRVIDEDRQVSAVDKQPSRGSQLIAARPVSARSVLPTVLLGTDQPRLTVGELVAMASLFGISQGAARTSLW